ncbi:MAG: hypothetical protein E7603_08285 [Ruminococcaceae bacterium]|nr:hypothetical protein [Oscillospiraceae bacterium]
MIMLNYDFYDIHGVLLAIRANPTAPYHANAIKSIYEVLSSPQIDNKGESNLIRKTLRTTVIGVEDTPLAWIYVDNVYTYGWKFIKDDFCFSFLAKGFQKLLTYASNGNYKQLEDLADALHNVPIFFADGCKNFKKAIKVQFSYYDKTYKTNLLKELSK